MSVAEKEKTWDAGTLRDNILKNIEDGDTPHAALMKVLHEILDEEQQHAILVHPPQIPTIGEMKLLFENNEDFPNPDEFRETIAWELAMMASYAARAKIPNIVLSSGRKAGEQHIYEFFVNDLVKPRKPTYNCHGQNTSQWCYAGAIMVQEGRVSTHH